MADIRQDPLPVIHNLADFDPRSGNRLERLVFNHRLAFVLCMLLATLVLGYMALTRLELRPSFEKMLPQSHPYIQNYLANRQSLRGLGNSCGWWWKTPAATSSTPTTCRPCARSTTSCFSATVSTVPG